MEVKKNRLWFIQASRGIACLLIVYAHWSGLLLDPNATTSIAYQLPIPQEYHEPGVVRLLVETLARVTSSDFSEVHFGLGLFFLISGFVIPLSMGKSSQIEFLLRRIFRIYPVLIVSTLCTLSLICIARIADGLPAVPLSLTAIIVNLLLVRDVAQHQFIDVAVWTLEIEAHFYLICFLIGFFDGHKKSTFILTVALILCACSYYAGSPSLANTQEGVWVDVIGMNGAFITLMLIGTVLYNRGFNEWSLKKTVFTIIILLVANKFSLANYHQFTGTTGNIMYGNHLLVFLFFISMILADDRLPYVKWLDRLAEVSYPLYLLHGFGAYSIFYIFMKKTNSIALSFSAAVAVTIILTWIVHKYVERLGINIGKKIKITSLVECNSKLLDRVFPKYRN